MKKIKFLIPFGLFGGLAVALCLASLSYTTNKVNSVNCNWLDNYPGYEDYITGPSEEAEKNLRTYTYFTDEECVDTLFGTHLQGRWVRRDKYEVDELGFTTKLVESKYQEWIPSKIERKTIKAVKVGEKDTNEWCDSLTGFLNDYINSPTGSYDSFSKYIDYLVNDFGMYEEEAESYRYNWRYAHDALTDEEKKALQDEADKKAEEDKKKQEELDKILDDMYDIAKENEKNKLTLYVKEANMIERTIPAYYHFDRDNFILLREKGVSYTDAYEQSISINYEEGIEDIANTMKENEDWYEKMYDTISSDSFQETMKNISDNLGDFFKELFSISDSSDIEEGESD